MKCLFRSLLPIFYWVVFLADLQEFFIYYRIIDYKTGSTSFDIEKVKAGLQLQLAIYTAEAAATLFEAGDTPVAAGMYYYRIDDPLIEVKPGSSGNDTDSEAEIIKKQKLDGLTVGDDEVLAL